MSKHTPGPWRIVPGGVRVGSGLICSTFQAMRYPGQEERFKRESAEREANAHLIAAAPDLLEALLRCRFDSLNMSAEDMRLVQAAIAKATGGYP